MDLAAYALEREHAGELLRYLHSAALDVGKGLAYISTESGEQLLRQQSRVKAAVQEARMEPNLRDLCGAWTPWRVEPHKAYRTVAGVLYRAFRDHQSKAFVPALVLVMYRIRARTTGPISRLVASRNHVIQRDIIPIRGSVK